MTALEHFAAALLGSVIGVLVCLCVMVVMT